MTGTSWFRVRIAFLAVMFFSALLSPAKRSVDSASSPLDAVFLVFVGILIFVCLASFIVGFVFAQSHVKGANDTLWKRPIHRSNPFDGSLQFVHFFGSVATTVGVASVISSIWNGKNAVIEGAFELIFGLALFAGLYVSRRIFNDKFEA